MEPIKAFGLEWKFFDSHASKFENEKILEFYTCEYCRHQLYIVRVGSGWKWYVPLLKEKDGYGWIPITDFKKGGAMSIFQAMHKAKEWVDEKEITEPVFKKDTENQYHIIEAFGIKWTCRGDEIRALENKPMIYIWRENFLQNGWRIAFTQELEILKADCQVEAMRKAVDWLNTTIEERIKKRPLTTDESWWDKQFKEYKKRKREMSEKIFNETSPIQSPEKERLKRIAEEAEKLKGKRCKEDVWLDTEYRLTEEIVELKRQLQEKGQENTRLKVHIERLYEYAYSALLYVATGNHVERLKDAKKELKKIYNTAMQDETISGLFRLFMPAWNKFDTERLNKQIIKLQDKEIAELKRQLQEKEQENTRLANGYAAEIITNSNKKFMRDLYTCSEYYDKVPIVDENGRWVYSESYFKLNAKSMKLKTIEAWVELERQYRSNNKSPVCPLCKIYTTCKGCPLAGGDKFLGCENFHSRKAWKKALNEYNFLSAQSFNNKNIEYSKKVYEKASQSRADFFKNTLPTIIQIPAERFTPESWTYFDELNRND